MVQNKNRTKNKRQTNINFRVGQYVQYQDLKWIGKIIERKGKQLKIKWINMKKPQTTSDTVFHKYNAYVLSQATKQQIEAYKKEQLKNLARDI